MGGGCAKRGSILHRIVDIFFMCFIFASLAYFLFHLAFKTSWFGLVLSIAQLPILMIVFWSSIKYLKKKKASAKKNKYISIAVLIIANVTYLALLMAFIMQFGFSMGNDSNYRTVDWQLTATENHEYNYIAMKSLLHVKIYTAQLTMNIIRMKERQIVLFFFPKVLFVKNHCQQKIALHG
jgi:predicted membrane-bound dolichyl-phosphate-mannose-protein mannosyltransferase